MKRLGVVEYMRRRWTVFLVSKLWGNVYRQILDIDDLRI